MFIPIGFWQLSEQPATPGLTALNYGRFVAVRTNGINNRAQWSNDGITWNLATTNNNTWSSIGFSPELGLYVVTSAGSGLADNIMTSTNGVTWTVISKPDTQALRAVTWCSTWNKFLIYGASNIFESTDGVNWSLGFFHGLGSSFIAAQRGLFTTFSSTSETGGTSSAGRSIYAVPTNFLSGGQTMIIYSEDGLNFKTYSVSGASQLMRSVVFTRDNWNDHYIGMQNTGNRILSTQSMNATSSTSWNQLTSTTGTVYSNQNSSLQPMDYRGCVVYCLNSTATTTTPLRYSLSYSGSGPSIQTIVFPSAIYSFRDVCYSRALSLWVVVSGANITSGAIWTSSAASTAAPGTWTSRTAAGGTIEGIAFAEGVRTTGYRRGAGIT